MRDSVYALQKAYKIALAGINYNSVGVPAYYQELPDDMTADNYIIYTPVSNNDTSTMTSADTFSSMQVTIHTFDNKYNTGKAAGAIAADILSRIYPNPQFNLDLSADNLQMTDTFLSTDIPQDYKQLGTRNYNDRILIFRHKIFHR